MPKQKRNLDKDNYLKCENLKAMTGINKTPKKEKTTLTSNLMEGDGTDGYYQL